jgi:hypothetical protein
MTAAPEPRPDRSALRPAPSAVVRLPHRPKSRPALRPDDGDRLLTTKEAARYTPYSAHGLANLRSAGKGPAYIKIRGGSVAYRLADLLAWQASHRVSTFDQL